MIRRAASRECASSGGRSKAATAGRGIPARESALGWATPERFVRAGFGD